MQEKKQITAKPCERVVQTPEKERDGVKKAPYIPTREVPDPPVPNRAHTEM